MLQIDPSNPHFREMLREQVLGDRERIADIQAGREAADALDEVSQRLAYVEGLALDALVMTGA